MWNDFSPMRMDARRLNYVVFVSLKEEYNPMLTPAQIIERYSNGQAGVPADQMVNSTVALPPGWTEDDTKGFGLPVVIGHPDTGFVGVIESVAPTGIPRWIGESSRQRFAEAQQDVVERAMLMKQGRASAEPAT